MGANLTPQQTSMAELVRTRRKERGWSLAQLAKEVDLKSPSYILEIEKGNKVPNVELATKLARALGEDKHAFVAWAELRREPNEALATASTVTRYMQRRSAREDVAEERGSHSISLATSFSDFAELSGSLPLFPTRVLLLAEFEDPYPGLGADGDEKWVEIEPDFPLDPRIARDLGSLADPFAYPLDKQLKSRLPPHLGEGDIVVLTRQVRPISRGRIYAVRIEGNLGPRIRLARVRWSMPKQQLLVLPVEQDDDFEVLPAVSERELLSLIAGRVVAVLPAEALRPAGQREIDDRE
jgi:transcriptional regulator with XRE-family HTH domain